MTVNLSAQNIGISLCSCRFAIRYVITSTSKDGYVRQYNDYISWSEAHDKTSGNAVGDSDSTADAYAKLENLSPQRPDICRGFLPFDFSSLPTNRTLFYAKLTVVGVKKDSGTSPKITVQEGTQADTLTTDDYDAFTGSYFTLLEPPSSQATFGNTFNAAGLSYLESKVGSTAKLCLREYDHDYLDQCPSDTTTYGSSIHASESTVEDPTLTLYFAEGVYCSTQYIEIEPQPCQFNPCLCRQIGIHLCVLPVRIEPSAREIGIENPQLSTAVNVNEISVETVIRPVTTDVYLPREIEILQHGLPVFCNVAAGETEIQQVDRVHLENPPGTSEVLGKGYVADVGDTPGFSCVVKECWIYADGSGAPITWGGDNPCVSGFLVWDDSENKHLDYTKIVNDRTDSYAVVTPAAGDEFYVCSPEIAHAIILSISEGQTNPSQLKCYSKVNGSWEERTLLGDGTKQGSITLSHSGVIQWERNSSDSMSVIAGIMGYWYKFTRTAAFSNSVKITECRVRYNFATISNKWSGVYEWLSGCRFYNGETYTEALGQVSNESINDSLSIGNAGTNAYLYLKTVEPATGFAIGIDPDAPNSIAAKIDLIEYNDGEQWQPITTFEDKTLNSAGDTSFAQSGTLFFDGSEINPVRCTLSGDPAPGFWYRISWDSVLGDTVNIYMIMTATYPEELGTYDGCVDFKSRLMLWGDRTYPNRLRYSAFDFPDCFSGSDSGYTDPFGDLKPVLNAINFYNELIVFKQDSIWLLEGYSPATFGTLKISDTVGLAHPKTAHVIETGFPSMHRDEPLSIAIWCDTDGVYVLDGRKPRKVSLPVDHYFNSEYDTCIPAGTTLQAFTDPLNNEYHLLLPSTELVYNYITDEWYPAWERNCPITTGLSLHGTDEHIYTYGGYNGHLFRLEHTTTDRNTADEAKAIEHYLVTRTICATPKQSPSMYFTLRRLWAELKSRDSGEIEVTLYKNVSSSGQVLATPQAMSVESAAGEDFVVPELDISEPGLFSFQIKFKGSSDSVVIEILSILFELEARGLIEL